MMFCARGHFSQHLAHVSFVALRAALIHAALFLDLLVRLPIQLVSFVNQDTAALTLP